MEAWLPELEDERPPVNLTLRANIRIISPQSPPLNLSYSHPADETLADVNTDFLGAIANKDIETIRLGSLGPFNKAYPLELAVFKLGRRLERKTVRANLLRLDLPASALIRIDPSLWVTCPELTVMLLAKRLSAIELAQVIMELCGSYSLYPDPTAQGEPPRYNLPPVMSLASLATFAQTARVRGNKTTLQTACQLACEYSASPMETNVALLLSAPPELGGYGFPKPELNAPLIPPEGERQHLSQQGYSLDLFWQSCLADVECESTEHHLDPLTANVQDSSFAAWRTQSVLKEESDRRRFRELQYLGIQVIPVTSYDLRSEERTRSIARALARRFQACNARAIDEIVTRIDDPAAALARTSLLETLIPRRPEACTPTR